MTEAIDFKLRAFEFLQESQKYCLSDKLVDLAYSLSFWFEEKNETQEAHSKLQKALDILQTNYGVEDPRSCRVKRRIALIYMKK